jgi:hypothetical protein
VAFTTVTVTRDYDLADGTDPTGTVTFTPTTVMVNGVTVVAAPVKARLDVDGVLSIALAANTDPDTTPANSYYLVREDVGGAVRSYYVQIRHDAGVSVNLATLDSISAVTAPDSVTLATLLAGKQNVFRMPAASGSSATDTAVITAAIAAAPAGYTLQFDASGGAYKIQTPLAWAKKLTLDLQGATFQAAAGGLHEWLSVTSGGDGSHIVNGVFDSNGTGRTTIRFANCTNVGVSASRFVNKTTSVQADTAVKFNACTSGFVRACYFYNWGFVGADTNDVSTLTRCVAFSDANCAHCIVEGCDFDTVCRGVDIVGTGHRIVGNSLRNLVDNGFYLTASNTSGQFWRDITVTGNHIDGGDECIVLSGSNEATTEWCERATISGNVISGFRLAAVNWDHRVRDVAVGDNVISADYATPPPIMLGLRTSNQSAGCLTRNVKISNNQLRGTVSYAAIWLQNPQGACSISNNNADVTFSTSGLRFLKIDASCDGVFYGGNTWTVTSGSSVTGMWCTPTATNCKIGGNHLIGTTYPLAYGTTFTAGDPPGWAPQMVLNQDTDGNYYLITGG